MSSFTNDVAGIVRKFGLTTGAGAGVAASTTVYSGVASAGLLAAVPSAGIILVGWPVVGAYVGWWVAKKLTKAFED